MKLLPLEKLGTREKNDAEVDFGIFLPWISEKDGNRLWVKVIHEKDQFLQDIQTQDFELEHSIDPEYGDYWSTTIKIDPQSKPHPKSAWGETGRMFIAIVYKILIRERLIGLLTPLPENLVWVSYLLLH